MKKIITIHLSIIFILLSACNGVQVSEKLDYVDSLIVKEQYDSASIVMKDVANTSMTVEEQAHYYLLQTQIGYLTSQPLSSDSLLDLAIIYYNKEKNRQKLADAFYYKAYGKVLQNDFSEATYYYKSAEELADNTSNPHLQYKIYESLSAINEICGNYLLQLNYAKKALKIAQSIGNKGKVAYAYLWISSAYSELNYKDSAITYINKMIPLIDNVKKEDRPTFLVNAAYTLKHTSPDMAKTLLMESLSKEESSVTMQHLADIYRYEGNLDEAYRLWKKALTVNDGIPKDNALHNILDYDMEHGHTDHICETVNEIIHIKDSMLNSLRNDTIKDLQLRFDHEVAMHKADKKLISTQMLLLGLLIVVGIMAFYIFYRRKKTEAQEKEYQMQLYAYTTEINQLKANKDKAQSQIRDLESSKDIDGQRISELEEEVRNAEIAIDDLQKNVKKLLDDKAPKLKKGRVLYDIIMDGGTILKWDRSDDIYFVTYYEAINYKFSNRIKKIKRAARLTPHNTIYLILKDMGKDDNEIRRIMVLTPEGLRSIRMRTRPIDESDS